MNETFGEDRPRFQLCLPAKSADVLGAQCVAAGIGFVRVNPADLFSQPRAPLARLPVFISLAGKTVAGTDVPAQEIANLSKIAPVVVILDDDALDDATSVMDIEGVELAVWPLEAEGTLSILERIDTRNGYATGFREGRDDAFVQIGMLSDEVGRIADQLARLATLRGEAPALPVLLDRDSAETARAIREMIRKRQARKQFFPAELFADPAWDIVLDLAAARLEGKQVSVSSLCIAADVPTTTALRWIKGMTDAGLLVRRNDPQDGRRSFIDLSDNAIESMERYISLVESGAI